MTSLARKLVVYAAGRRRPSHIAILKREANDPGSSRRIQTGIFDGWSRHLAEPMRDVFSALISCAIVAQIVLRSSPRASSHAKNKGPLARSSAEPLNSRRRHLESVQLLDPEVGSGARELSRRVDPPSCGATET